MQKQRLTGTIYKTSFAVKEVDGRILRGIASQQIVDRDGDVILTSGIQTANFKANPALLANHDHSFNLGTVSQLWQERRAGVPTLLFEAELLDPVSERQREVVAAIEAGVRRAFSIGFRALEYDDKAVLEGQSGYTFRKIELLELSSVSLPACQTCLTTSKAWRERGAGCGCGEGVLELDDSADLIEVSDDLYRAALAATARRKMNPAIRAGLVEPDRYDIDPAALRSALSAAVKEGLRATVATEVERALDRIRGRVI
jgi:hypothetical protein